MQKLLAFIGAVVTITSAHSSGGTSMNKRSIWTPVNLLGSMRVICDLYDQ